MAILNLSCTKPVVIDADYSSKSYWVGGYYTGCRHYSKVKINQAVWFTMLNTIINLGNDATSQNIRTCMGWGSNADRGHCDYFTTLRHNGVIDYVRKNGKPVYFLTSYGKSVVNRSVEMWPAEWEKATAKGTDRPEWERREKLAAKRAEQAKIKAEAKND